MQPWEARVMEEGRRSYKGGGGGRGFLQFHTSHGGFHGRHNRGPEEDVAASDNWWGANGSHHRRPQQHSGGEVVQLAEGRGGSIRWKEGFGRIRVVVGDQGMEGLGVGSRAVMVLSRKRRPGGGSRVAAVDRWRQGLGARSDLVVLVDLWKRGLGGSRALLVVVNQQKRGSRVVVVED